MIWWYLLIAMKNKLMKEYSGKYVKSYNNQIDQNSLKFI